MSLSLKSFILSSPSVVQPLALALRIVGGAAFCLYAICSPVVAQRKDANHDESLVQLGALPELLPGEPGKFHRDQWGARRQEIVRLLAENQFGDAPKEKASLSYRKVEEGAMYDGLTWREQYVVELSTANGKQEIDLAVFWPSKKNPCGLFLGLNFQGNHSVNADPTLRIPTSWVANNQENGVVENRASEKGRGAQSERWPIREINERGYAVATAYYGDIDPDFDDGFENGVHKLFPEHKPDAAHPSRWGAIAAWAWGLSRLLDVLQEQPRMDRAKVAVVGHSRLGKTALWAGATDERFSIVISNNSGCGGAALERRNFGETVAIINKSFPHWFCDNFNRFSNNETEMPHDSHFLIAANAPRAVYITSATKDLWADPKGEYLSGYYASPVYKLLGYDGLGSATPPPPDTVVGERIRYHNRTGNHDILSYDWQRFMDFADKQWSQ